MTSNAFRMPGKPRVSAYRWPVSRQRDQPFLNLLRNHFEGKRGNRALSGAFIRSTSSTSLRPTPIATAHSAINANTASACGPVWRSIHSANFTSSSTISTLPSGSSRHPTAAWTLQQLREAIPSDHRYRFILHDRDAIFSTGFDASLARMGLEVIATPVRSPKANSLCERLIGTLRRECLDWIIPLTEQHLRKALWSWLPHYNRGRPHSSLGPGLPDPPLNLPVQFQRCRSRFPPTLHFVILPVTHGPAVVPKHYAVCSAMRQSKCARCNRRITERATWPDSCGRVALRSIRYSR